MDILAFLDVLWRRRWVVIPALLAAVGLTFGVAKIVKPTYKATSTIVLYAPTIPQGNAKPLAGPTNPLLGVAGLHDVTDVVVARMTDPVVVKELGTAKGWSVANVDGSSTPLLIIATQKKTPEEALALSDRLDRLVEEQLVLLQTTSGTPPQYLIHSRLVQKDTTAGAVQGSRMRAVAGTGALSVLLVVSLAFAVEAMLNARERKARHTRNRSSAPRAKRSRRERRREKVAESNGDRSDDGERVDQEANDLPVTPPTIGVAPPARVPRAAGARDA